MVVPQVTVVTFPASSLISRAILRLAAILQNGAEQQPQNSTIRSHPNKNSSHTLARVIFNKLHK
eukprot:COSAG04_NODE_8369_length_984_cov_20.101695_1_plen_64_part_00